MALDNFLSFPTLALAVACEAVTDVGAMVRLDGIRTLWVAAPGEASKEVRYYIEFWTNGFVGDLEFVMRIIGPNGGQEGEAREVWHFEAGMHSFRNTGPLDLNVTRSGVYWLDVMLDGQFMTRIPIAIAHDSATDVTGGLPDVPGDNAGPYVGIASFVYWSDRPNSNELALQRVPPFLPVTMDQAGHVDQGKQHLLAELAGWLRLYPGALPAGQHVASFRWAFPDGDVSAPNEVNFESGFPVAPTDLTFKAEVDFERPGPYELRVEIEGQLIKLPMELRPSGDR